MKKATFIHACCLVAFVAFVEAGLSPLMLNSVYARAGQEVHRLYNAQAQADAAPAFQDVADAINAAVYEHSNDFLIFTLTGNAAIVLGLLWLLLSDRGVFFGFGSARRAIRKKRGRCPKCNYDLRGNRGGDKGCSECGWSRPETRPIDR